MCILVYVLSFYFYLEFTVIFATKQADVFG